jgi:hypothetical protein
VRPGRTIYIPFESFASATGAPITITGLATSDILIYKDGGTTQRASTSGFTLLDTDGIDFDGITGIHGFSIDLSDNTTAGFYAAGSQYFIVVSTVTVDSQAMSFLAAWFRIGYDAAVLNTTIATLSTQTSFTLTTGPAEDDAMNGSIVLIHDVASNVQQTYAVVADYTGSTKTVTLAAAGTFTVAASDNISFFPPALTATIAGRTLDVSATGEAGVDWANVGSPTTSLALTGTTIATTQQVDVNTIKTQTVTLSGGVTIPAATLASTTNITAGTMTTATNVTTLSSGAISAASFAAGAIDAAAIATDAIGSAELAASAVNEIADQVWDEVLSGHLTAGTTGAALNAAGAAGDPWSTAIPGAYGAGTAGKIVGDNLNATVSSRLASASYTAPLDASGTRAAVGLASANLDTQLSTINSAVDTEVGAIKAKTDQLGFIGGRVDATIGAINGNATAAQNLERSALTIYRGTVTGTSTTTTVVDSGLTQSAADFWKGRIVIFVTGTLAGQASDITAFTPATDTLTITALTGSPSVSDNFVIV